MPTPRPYLVLPLLVCLAAAPATQPQPHYAIIVTGGELLAGAYADGHTHFLTRTLQPLGLRCIASVTVDDRPDDIKNALRFASGSAKLIIVTGGLGPTDNDLTRETLADFTAIPLRENPDVLGDMASRFNTPAERMRPNLRRQAQTPTRGTYLKNDHGSAVGLVFEGPEVTVVALPGPPRELQPMAREQLLPYLARRFGTRPPGPSLTIRFIGVGQSQINQTLRDQALLPDGVVLTSQFTAGRVDFTFTYPVDTPESRARLQKLKQGIHEHLDEFIYADDEHTTLEEHVAALLAEHKVALGIADAASAGVVAAALSCGRGDPVALVAPDDQKLRHLLRIPDQRWNASPDTLPLLAEAAARLDGANAALVLSEPRADASGARFVRAVLPLPGGRSQHVRLALRGAGASAREDLATAILDRLRRGFRTRPQ